MSWERVIRTFIFAALPIQTVRLRSSVQRGEVLFLHLEQAETGLDTLRRGVSAALWPKRVIFFYFTGAKDQALLKAVQISRFPYSPAR
jgi:hypothetical protein